MPNLTDTERDIIAIESKWWRYAGAKEQAIHDKLGISATRFYQLLNAMLDDPRVEAAEPVIVHRLRRVRAERRR